MADFPIFKTTMKILLNIFGYIGHISHLFQDSHSIPIISIFQHSHSPYILVGGGEHFLFSIMYGIILPIDFHIFQDG